MLIGATIYVLTVIAAVEGIRRYRNKARRLAQASVLRRIEGCDKRHCTCVK